MLYMAKLWGYELLEKFKFHLESGKIEKKDYSDKNEFSLIEK